MALPQEPVTLSVEQIAELNTRLSKMRHDINGATAHVMAAAELIRLKPELLDKYLPRILEQPMRICDMLKQFSAEFEKALDIKRY